MIFENKINIDFALKVLQLDDWLIYYMESFLKDLKSFRKNLNESEYYYFYLFINKETLKKNYDLLEEYEIKNEWHKFLKENFEIINTLIKNNTFENFYRIAAFYNEEMPIHSFYQFLQYITENLDKKEIIVNNLNKLKALNIKEFSFNSDFQSENYTCVDYYCPISDQTIEHFTDGKLAYEQDIENKEYSTLKVYENSNYTISREKNINNVVTMNINNLMFKSNTLPNINDLYASKTKRKKQSI